MPGEERVGGVCQPLSRPGEDPAGGIDTTRGADPGDTVTGTTGSIGTSPTGGMPGGQSGSESSSEASE